MDITIQDVLETLKDEKYVSISLIQRKLGIGFPKAGRLFTELVEQGYAVKSSGHLYFLKRCNRGALKLIFLDIDGVLNFRGTKDCVGKYLGIDDGKVSLLKEVVDKTDAKIILVSTWNYFWYKDEHLKEKQDEFANHLDEKLAKQGLSIFDKAESLEVMNRGESVLDYINKLNRKGFEVDKFVIIDDEMFDYKELKLTKNLVQTSFENGGLLKKHISKIVAKLS